MEESKQAVYLLTGDLGGTQVRMSLFNVSASRTDPVFVYKAKTQETKSLHEEINKAIEQASFKGVIQAAVFGIAGPVDEVQGRVKILLDVPQWGSISEQELQEQTGVKKVKLLNDFVVNGYGIAGLGPEDILKVHDAQNQKNLVRLVFGVGTGLGVCILARPNEGVPYQAYPSEAGLNKMQYYNKADKEFHQFIKDQGYTKSSDGEREDISMVLGGCGLPSVAAYLASKPENQERYRAESQLFQEYFLVDSKVLPTPEAVTHAAEHYRDPLALDTVCHILTEYTAKVLADLCLITLPYGGVFLTGSVFQVGMRFAFEDTGLRERFLEKLQNRGSQAELLKRIPVTLVLRRDLAILGCLQYAKDFLHI